MPIEHLLEGIATFALQNLWLFFISCVLCTMIWGDATLIGFIMVAMTLNINLGFVFLGAYLGTIIGDVIWFKIGLELEKRIIKNRRIDIEYKNIAKFISKVFKKRLFLALGLAKLLAGTRVIMVFYFVKQKIKFRKFFIYNLFATLIWISIIGAVGLAAGYGLSYISDIFEGLQWTILIVFVFIFAINYFQRWINKKIKK